MRIYLMRHGDYSKEKLTRLGKKQVKFSSEYLKKCNIGKIYSSPTTRCIQSSEIVSKVLNKQFEVRRELNERSKIASLRDNDKEEWFKNYLNMNYSCKNIGGSKEFFDRVKSLINEVISNSNKDENILFVGHSSISYAMAAYFFKEKEWVTWMAMGNASIICFEVMENENEQGK